MKVSLKNFRCHVDREFDFPAEGLVALSGKSGTGKSTIMSAIAYALYGKIPGRVKKTKTHGSEKSSRVEVCIPVGENNELLVVRTSKPKTITAVLDEVEYEGDAAESIIQQSTSMNYEEFMAGAYIVQRSNASVLSMTPMEQIKFVELLANHQGVEEFKTMLKDKIKECKAAKLKKQGELEGLETQLEELRQQEPEEVPDTPEEIENGIDPEEVRNTLTKHEDSLVRINGEIQEVQRKLTKARESDAAGAETKKKIQKLRAEITVFEQRLTDLGDEVELEDIAAAEQALSEAAEAVETHAKHEKVHADILQLDEAIQAHYDASAARIAKLQNDDISDEALAKLEAEEEALTTAAHDYDVRKSVFDLSKKKKEEARKKLAAIFKQIKADFPGPDVSDIKTPNKMIAFLKGCSGLCLECPKCKSNLSYDEHTKVVEIVPFGAVADNQTTRMKALEYTKLIEDNGRDLGIELDDPGPDRPDSSATTKALLKAKRIREELAACENAELSTTLLKMQARITKAAEELNMPTDPESTRESVKVSGIVKQEFQEMLNEARKAYEELVRVGLEIANTKSEIKKRTGQIEKLSATLPKKDTGSKPGAEGTAKLEKTLSALTQRSADANMHITNARDLIDSFAEYETYMAYEGECTKLQKRIDTVLKCMAAYDKSLEGFYGLEDAGREAEILSLEETVRSINEHARVYLDQMFEDPIVVELRCVKEVKTKKTTKLQLNTTILYQGETYENVEELSGGERQRCDMAFLLAVNDMVGAKMIFLDECLNNLDATINTDVLSMIRDLCGGHKLILVVSHEAVRGVFDTEVFV